MKHIKRKELWVHIIVWGGLIVAWNFGYPGAKPWMDVLAAVIIFFITRFTLKSPFIMND